MSERYILADCPRCGAKSTTFDVNNANKCSFHKYSNSIDVFEDYISPYDYASRYELLTVCRNCQHEITFVVSEPFDYEHDAVIPREPPMNMTGSLEGVFDIEGILRLSDNLAIAPPEFMPRDIERTFREGIECLSINCWNAAGTMFRKCLDLTAKDKLEKKVLEQLEKDRKNTLYHKISELFNNKVLSSDLKKIATYIRLDGNDGAHGLMLTRYDAMILLDSTVLLLGRIYTEPERIRQIDERRAERKKNPNGLRIDFSKIGAVPKNN